MRCKIYYTIAILASILSGCAESHRTVIESKIEASAGVQGGFIETNDSTSSRLPFKRTDPDIFNNQCAIAHNHLLCVGGHLSRLNYIGNVELVDTTVSEDLYVDGDLTLKKSHANEIVTTGNLNSFDSTISGKADIGKNIFSQRTRFLSTVIANGTIEARKTTFALGVKTD